MPISGIVCGSRGRIPGGIPNDMPRPAGVCSTVPCRNQSPSGWWIFREVEYWVASGKKTSPRTRHLVWENTRLIRAGNRDEAHRKAVELGRAGHPSKTEDGEWRFAGISMLLPVYEDLEDGAEILWEVRGSLPIESIRKRVRTRRTLPVFDDVEEG